MGLLWLESVLLQHNVIFLNPKACLHSLCVHVPKNCRERIRLHCFYRWTVLWSPRNVLVGSWGGGARGRGARRRMVEGPCQSQRKEHQPVSPPAAGINTERERGKERGRGKIRCGRNLGTAYRVWDVCLPVCGIQPIHIYIDWKSYRGV